jgi:hypothetical protein
MRSGLARSAGMRVLVGLLALLLSGCGGGTESQGLESEVRFSRGGGIAGVQQELVIAPDGSARVTSRGRTVERFRVNDAQRDAIVRDLESARFSSLPKDASPGPPVPDDFGYTVTYDGHTSSAQGSRMPDRFARAIDTLGDVARAHGM